MENQKQFSGSYFGPRLRMSTRSKATNGSRRRRGSRFRSQRMNKIAKDMEKRKAYMLPKTRNRNDRSGVGVTSNAHMRSGKQACGSDKKDQDGNIISPQAKRVPPTNSRAEQSSDVLPVKENRLIPLMDNIKSSNPSSVKNVLPLEELENRTPLLPKNGSITKLRYQKLSHFRNRTSHPIDVEVMAKLAHRVENNDASKNEDDTLASKSNGQSNHTQGQDINVKSHTKEISKTLASEPLVPNEYDSNEYKARRDEVTNVKEIDVETRMFGNDLSRHQACNKRCNKRKEEKEEGKFRTRDNDGSTRVVQRDNLTIRSIKRIRYNEEDEDEVGACDKNLMGVDASIGLTPQATVLNNCVERQCDYCSKPINEPAWGGIFKIGGKEYISVVGHLSTKSCEKVWKLSKSLPPVVEVEMVSRLVVWPRIWKMSKASADNIGLYFLSDNMRHDEELDQLVNKVMKNDLVLRAIINEVEMLIFPSVLLPERYQMFQAKHYLWAAFKPKEDKGAVLAEPLDGTGNQQIKK